jgi:hypothetical protein
MVDNIIKQVIEFKSLIYSYLKFIVSANCISFAKELK